MTTERGRRPSLPSYLTRFVGREHELAELRRLLTPPPDHARRGHDRPPVPRVVTLCGVGGSGKTRLALELARDVEQASAEAAGPLDDAVYWVPLGPLVDPGQLTRAVATVFGLPGAVPAHALAALRQSIGSRRALLVLDNCEHLLDACRALVAALVGACPGLLVLTTSRAPLGLAGESVLPVPPLRLTASDVEPGVGAGGSEAARLFLERAAIGSAAGPSRAVRATVDQICERLDGLPLAIELAASWMRVLSARDLLTEIDHGIEFLSSSLPQIAERHRSLQVVLESSWLRLTPQDRRLLSALSVFSGDFSREAAGAVAGATLVSLSALAEKSLIQRRPEVEHETRYHIHELVRQDALRRLEAEGPREVDAARDAHLEHFLAVVERAEKTWDTAAEREWLDRLRADQANLGAALLWALDRQRTELALRLAAGLFAFWIYTLPPELYRVPLERALALPWDPDSASTTRARARALNVAGYAAVIAADHEQALGLFEEGLQLYRRLDDASAVAWALRGRGYACRLRGDPDPEDDLQSLALCRANGDAAGVAWSVHDLGEVAFVQGDLDRAEQLLEEGLSLLEEQGVWFGAYRAVVMLGGVHVRQGRWSRAVARYEEGLARQRASHFVARGGQILEGLAVTATAMHRPVAAARLLGAGTAWRRTFGFPRGAYDVGVGTAVTAVRRQLGPAAWSAHHGAGGRLAPDQAMDEAELQCQELASVTAARDSRLTQRQLEVLLALAQGLSNAEIADRLVLSTRTVHAHLRTIFDKLEVSTRTAAARRAAELNLVGGAGLPYDGA